jgi:hypothetical protein
MADHGPDSGSLQQQLERQEQLAREELHRARTKFRELLAARPALHDPEGSAELQRAGVEVHFLERKCSEARKRLMEYLVPGETKVEEVRDVDVHQAPAKNDDWPRLLDAYRAAVQYLDHLVKSSRTLGGQEFDQAQGNIEKAKRTCEEARTAIDQYLGSSKTC